MDCAIENGLVCTPTLHCSFSLPLDLMPKLWIVHRNPQSQAALSRLSGLPAPDVFAAAPSDAGFAEIAAPAAVLLALKGDFEHELNFAHQHREALQRTRWILLCEPRDAAEARRLFAPADIEILESPPTARTLRALVASAVAKRSADSLADRRHRDRIAERFSSWLAEVEIPGLLRALDPALARFPLLARGRMGSGRALLGRYVELFRGAKGELFRIHARDVESAEDLARRIRKSNTNRDTPVQTVWVDEIDQLDPSAQNALAEWIVHDTPPTAGVGFGLRFLATAGPSGFNDRLETSLERAFSPLTLEIPALDSQPGMLRRFVKEVSRAWTGSVGGVPRGFTPEAIAALEAQPWSADRTEVEAVVRTSLAATSRVQLDVHDLHFPGDTFSSDEREEHTPAADPSPDLSTELTSTSEAMAAADSGDRNDDGDESPPRDPFLGHVGFAETHPEATDADAISPANPAAIAEPQVQPEQPLSEALFTPTAGGSLETNGDFADFERAFDEGVTHAEEAADLETESALSAGVGAAGATVFEILHEAETETEPEDIANADESARLAATVFDATLPAAAPPSTPSSTPSTLNAPSPQSSNAVPSDPTQDPGYANWRRLARSLSHEIRNPLVSIRTFAELLPEHFEDETFRNRFTELVGKDVATISNILTRLSSVAERKELAPGAVDVSTLIEGLLEARRDRIAAGRLLVLRELEREAPMAWADAQTLEVALAGLIDRALESLPERGDLFVATRHIERSADGAPRLRVLLRHHNPGLQSSQSGLAELDPATNVLEYVIAETVVEASGGTLTIDAADAQETLILVDLRTSANQ